MKVLIALKFPAIIEGEEVEVCAPYRVPVLSGVTEAIYNILTAEQHPDHPITIVECHDVRPPNRTYTTGAFTQYWLKEE